MEKLQELLTEYLKKYNSIVRITLNPEERTYTISGLDWNDRTVVMPWYDDIITIMETLIKDRYAYYSETDHYGM